MAWRGKAIGASVGVLAGGPVGALVGLFLGHLVDASQGDAPAGDVPAASIAVQEAFFRCTFSVMGHVAKADGHVTEKEIGAARAMMGELQLNERQVQAAISHYRKGKAADFQLNTALDELAHVIANHPDLRRSFLKIQLQTALWGGALNGSARKVLARVTKALDLSAYEAVQIEAVLRMQQASRDTRSVATNDRVARAYDVLGVSREASDSDVTQAYRRLMSRNHPDKLHAQGLPESQMKQAEEKTRQVRAAYDLIREARGTK